MTINNTSCYRSKIPFSRANLLTRCFTVEYAAWWRVVLPGIARLGLTVPLGGTTLFFRREALERLGGWDAHNVTEDADLGVRLARHGYETELLPTVTHEEATSRVWPWVRQRSRWLKGFLITYFVHMRDPKRLWRDLGAMRFLGIQMLFLASVLQFALAPFLWTYWIELAGISHPLRDLLGSQAATGLTTLFILSLGISLLTEATALIRARYWHLIPTLLVMPVYFLLGSLAAYKALWELIYTPFYWDKTQHGVT